MKTIRISRQGFTTHGMHSWMKYFIFVLSKKYNVVVDAVNPDIVFYSNLHFKEGEYDTFMKQNIVHHHQTDMNKKFIFVSGEVADFLSPIQNNPNVWSLGYQKFQHERYFRMPSFVFDAWTLFDEDRLYDTPFSWLTEKRDYDKIIKGQKGFCSITQASDVAYRGLIFDKLSEHKQVTSSGPWRANVLPEDSLNKYQWLNQVYIGRNDGLTYREKIDFFRKFKFNMAIHLTDTPYIVQEKLLHAFVAGAIPIFHGNRFIEEEGFNPESFINLHKFDNLDEFLELVVRIDTDNDLHKKYIESPIFVDNKLPDYFDFDNVLGFLETIVES
jgi:hypothetical protein